MKCLERILGVRKSGFQPRNFQLGGGKIGLQMTAIGFIDLGIELNQNVARSNALPIADMNCANDARFKRLNNFCAAGRDYFSGRRRDNVNLTKGSPDQQKSRRSP